MCALVTGVQTCALPICAAARLLRPGAEQASVAAAFEVARDHPARALLDEQGIELEDLLVLRRVLTGDGRSRAYVNDQAASAGPLRRSEEHTSELQSQMRHSYAVFSLKKQKHHTNNNTRHSQ